jgi:hypothetical protein
MDDAQARRALEAAASFARAPQARPACASAFNRELAAPRALPTHGPAPTRMGQGRLPVQCQCASTQSSDCGAASGVPPEPELQTKTFLQKTISRFSYPLQTPVGPNIATTVTQPPLQQAPLPSPRPLFLCLFHSSSGLLPFDHSVL